MVSPRSRSSRDPWQTNIICELGERVSVALFCLMPTRPLPLKSSCWRTQSPSSPVPHQFYVSTGIVFIWFHLSFCLCRLTEFLGAVFTSGATLLWVRRRMLTDDPLLFSLLPMCCMSCRLFLSLWVLDGIFWIMMVLLSRDSCPTDSRRALISNRAPSYVS